jgi:hypothetical protein
VDKRQVIAEIKRVAAGSGGKAPGRQRFEKATGIVMSTWYPHLWLRWGDALTEAGFPPNQLAVKMDSGLVLDKYIAFRAGTWPCPGGGRTPGQGTE